MKEKASNVEEILKGNISTAKYFRDAERPAKVTVLDIDGICDCGYLTLKPENAFESHNGGLTVAFRSIEISDGVKKLTLDEVKERHEILHFGCCNACVNGWRQIKLKKRG